jgi:hypothetical protein
MSEIVFVSEGGGRTTCVWFTATTCVASADGFINFGGVSTLSPSGSVSFSGRPSRVVVLLLSSFPGNVDGVGVSFFSVVRFLVEHSPFVMESGVSGRDSVGKFSSDLSLFSARCRVLVDFLDYSGSFLGQFLT